MTWARYLLMPWWTAQLATGAKAFCDNPIIGSPALNRWGLHVARIRVAAGLARARRRRLEALIEPADRLAFERDGFVLKRDFLPDAEFARLRAEVLGYAGPAREMVQGDTLTRRHALDRHARAAMPRVHALLQNATWRGLLRYVASFDSEPLVYIQSIHSQVNDADPDPQTRLHSDTFHPTVKAWLFLNDVAEDEGPFAYVPGSHRMTRRRLAWERRRSISAHASNDRLSARGSLRIAREELSSLGLPPPRLFAVPANTLIVADTSGFHARGPSARPSVRCEIWAYGRRNPFLPWTGLDPLSLPGIADRRIPWMWAANDRLKRFTGQPWRPSGARTTADTAFPAS